MPEGSEPIFVLGGSTLIGIGTLLSALVGVIGYLIRRLARTYDEHVAELRHTAEQVEHQHTLELARIEERHRQEMDRAEDRHTLATERLQGEVARLQTTEAEWRAMALRKEP